MTQVRILLVHDHEVVRAGYRRLLENAANLAVIAEAGSGDGAFSAYCGQRPDVVVMDLTLPGIGGLETIRHILAHDSAARILVFSIHENDVILNLALDMGVLGYIPKRSAAREMVEAVHRVATGSTYIGREMLPELVKHVPSLRAGSA